MTPDFKASVFDRAICAIAPERGIRRLAAKRVLHEFRYDGARSDNKRGSAPANMSPNSFDVQRDRLQLMREAEDMERNFAPAKMLNRKVAMYCTPQSYHASTGDQKLDREIEEYLADEAFLNCDVTGRYDFFKMMEFGVMGCNRGGDYGWAFQRPGAHEGMTEAELLALPLKIQAIEPDRIGGIYQNVVSNDYVSGLNIGEFGQIDSFRVFHRSMTTNTYDNPIDVPAKDFVHLTDPMRIDQYRGVSILATAIQNLRDLYEMMDFVKGKAKLASAITVFTNSNGATAGAGAFDPYRTNLTDGDLVRGQREVISPSDSCHDPAAVVGFHLEVAVLDAVFVNLSERGFVHDHLTAFLVEMPFSVAKLHQRDGADRAARFVNSWARPEFEKVRFHGKYFFWMSGGRSPCLNSPRFMIS